MANARELALNVLYDIEKNGAYLSISFQNHGERGDLDRRDAALCKELCYGVVKQKLILDEAILRYSSVKLKKLAPYVLCLLRLGLYQLYFMDKIPQSAAVNETVKLAGRYAGKSRGFVNAILRRAAKEPLALPEGDSPEALSVRYSHPLALTRWYLETFGKDVGESLLCENNRTPALCLRVNDLQTDTKALVAALKEAGITAHEGSLCAGSLVVEAGAVTRLEVYSKGHFTLQDQSAQLSALALAPKAGDRVYDLCAAPGGKTTHLAELMGNRGEIFASDIYEARLASVTKTAERLGIGIIQTCVAQAECYDFSAPADKILLDVPCSGLGVIRRRPDIKYKTELTDFAALVSLQSRMLDHAADNLAPGGVLVYSTCTVNPQENEEQIAAFLTRHPDFALSPAEHPKILGASKLKESGMETIFPTENGGDGFFVARLVKRER